MINKKQDFYYVLNNLEPGDILLTNNVSKKGFVNSTIQKKVTKGNFTHVLIHYGNGNLIESTNDGVSIKHASKIVFSEIKNFRLLRLKEYQEFDYSKFRETILKYSNMEYNFNAIFNYAHHKIKPSPFKVICSELATLMYLDYGIKLFEKEPSKVTPADFERSKLFVNVNNYYSKIDNLEGIDVIYDLDIELQVNEVSQYEKNIQQINKELQKAYKNCIPNITVCYNILLNLKSFEYMTDNIKNIDVDQIFIETFQDEVKEIIIDIFDIFKIETIDEIKSFFISLDRYFDDLLKKHGYYNDRCKIFVTKPFTINDQEAKEELLNYYSSYQAMYESIKKEVDYSLMQNYNKFHSIKNNTESSIIMLDFIQKYILLLENELCIKTNKS